MCRSSGMNSGQVPRRLLHPPPVRIGRHSSDPDASTLPVDDEEHDAPDQTRVCEYRHRDEVGLGNAPRAIRRSRVSEVMIGSIPGRGLPRNFLCFTARRRRSETVKVEPAATRSEDRQPRANLASYLMTTSRVPSRRPSDLNTQ